MSSSQSCANIHTGIDMTLETADNVANKGVDNPKLAWAGNGTDQRLQTPDITFAGTPITAAHLNSSFPSKIVCRSDLDLSKSPSSLTHKIFLHLNYAWKEKEDDWVPFIGFGGEAEFDSKSIKKRGVSQWGLWLKSGVAFE